MIKLLIGGSPCTHWSIAQHNGREKEASGLGWDLFKCYLTAKAKFMPDYFLYENNKSAAPAIKDQISAELGAPLHYINSALVSAQNRQRFYVHNFGDIGQPEDRGIVLDDILDSSEDETLYKLEHVTKGARCVASRGRYKEDGQMKFDDLTCCPFCGHNEYYEMQRITGVICFRTRYDGEEADNSEMYDGTNTTGNGRVYCSNCCEYIGNTKTGAIGKKAAERLKKRGEK